MPSISCRICAVVTIYWLAQDEYVIIHRPSIWHLELEIALSLHKADPLTITEELRTMPASHSSSKVRATIYHKTPHEHTRSLSLIRVRCMPTSKGLADAEPAGSRAIHVTSQCLLEGRLRDRCIYKHVSRGSQAVDPRKCYHPSR